MKFEDCLVIVKVVRAQTPDSREDLVISTVGGHRAGKHALTNAVCIGKSARRVFGFGYSFENKRDLRMLC